MRLILELQSGPDAPRAFPVPARVSVVLGRKAPAQVILSDPTVSRTHCALEFDGRTCRIKDLGSTHGTFVNETRVNASLVLPGDLIQVGASVLKAVFTESDAPLPPIRPSAPVVANETLDLPTLPPLHAQVDAALRAEPGTLYAILDAARAPLILARLQKCTDERKSLYAGVKGDALYAVAPHLIALPPSSTFLATLIRDGWGQSWGIYFTSPKSLPEVRKHLRHFLLVNLPSNEQVIFRYYDPRVLRVYLPTCTPDELIEFFGPIRSFLMESDDPGVMLRFRLDRGRLKTDRFEFADAAVEKSREPVKV